MDRPAQSELMRSAESRLIGLILEVPLVPSQTKQRFPRRSITGTDGSWEVNSAGIIYRHRHIQPISKDIAGLPTIDFGNKHINDKCVIPAYNGPVSSAGSADTQRLLDEIVCFEFH